MQRARLTITRMWHSRPRSLAKSLVSKRTVTCTQEDRIAHRRVSHLGCNSGLRPPAIRNLAGSVPIFAISQTGGNPNDSDYRIQQGSLDFDGDSGLDARRLVRGRDGAGGIAPGSAGRPLPRAAISPSDPQLELLDRLRRMEERLDNSVTKQNDELSREVQELKSANRNQSQQFPPVPAASRPDVGQGGGSAGGNGSSYSISSSLGGGSASGGGDPTTTGRAQVVGQQGGRLPAAGPPLRRLGRRGDREQSALAGRIDDLGAADALGAGHGVRSRPIPGVQQRCDGARISRALGTSYGLLLSGPFPARCLG